MRAFLLSLLLAGHALAAAPEAHRDLFYTEAKEKLQSLDLYAPAAGANHPVIVWIHGGGWRQGDKAGLQQKPRAFVEKGYVLVSINYRFVPAVTIPEMMNDVAQAVRWVHQHAAEYRGDPQSVTVMGHSAGAHLAALICTDDRYLKAAGVPMTILKGCVPIDVSVYDLPKRLQEGSRAGAGNFIDVFGKTEAEQREYSPVTHVAKGKNIPPFLILHVADREDSKAQSHWLAEKLREAGVAATVFAGEGKTHGTISSDLGAAEDPPTLAVWQFLQQVNARP
jgi:arylformamidase